MVRARRLEMLDASEDASKGMTTQPVNSMQDHEDIQVTEIKDDGGSCLVIQKSFSLDKPYNDDRLFAVTKNRLKRNVCMIKGIGPQTRQKLKKKLVRGIADLVYSARRSWRQQASELLAWIEKRQVAKLLETRRAKLIDLMYCFSPEKVAYIDIETTGFIDARIFAIAIGLIRPAENVFTVVQFLAREYQEEITILQKACEFLQEFDCIVSFNGKAFDLPMIRDRSWYFFGANASELDLYHVDLMHDARRMLGLKNRAPLSFYEKDILGIHRPLDVPSSAIPGIYMTFVDGGNGDAFTRFLLSRSHHDAAVLPNDILGYDETVEALALTGMVRVIYHNMLDVKTLHDLIVHLLEHPFKANR
ncbi:MAG TPA: ribonuclease H-like domain-containing protein [Candidatus Lokiarchaeia archaeon]|nr:ribonuclease H-like domain-containing protein [Candidatus Lokiarchaeia archaeon]